MATTAPRTGYAPVNGLRMDAIASINAATLLIIGDSVIVRPEDAVETFRLLGGGVHGDLAGLPASPLAVHPETSHTPIPQRADLLLPMTRSFLNATMPEGR